jgi:hypothetical protein
MPKELSIQIRRYDPDRWEDCDWQTQVRIVRTVPEARAIEWNGAADELAAFALDGITATLED